MCFEELILVLNCRAWIDQGGRIFIKNVLRWLVILSFQPKCSMELLQVRCGSVKAMCCFLRSGDDFSLGIRLSWASVSVYRVQTLSLQ